MRFDAYAGTIREQEFPYVAECIEASLGGIITKGNPRRRYGEVLDIDLAGRQAAWVGWDHGNGSVYFEGKGETSPDLVKAIRTYFPDHTVARADVCEDYDGPGVFERLVEITRRHKGPKVKGAFVRLPDDPSEGRTYEAGVRGGVAMTRAYEAGKMADRLCYGRPDWARLEGEFRPHYAKDKAAAARMTPLQFWGFSAWTQRLGEFVAECEIPRVQIPVRESSHEKTSLYLARAFRRHWVEMLGDHGDWVCIGREFEAIWREDDEVKARLGGSR